MNQMPGKTGAGTLDPSFGTDGVVALPFPGIIGSVPRAVLALPQNKLLIAVGTTKPENAPAKVARLNEDGTLDDLFGKQGIVEVPFEDGIWFSPSNLRPLEDGGWLITGTAEGTSVDLAVVRQNKDGELDASFGKGGKVTYNVYDLIGSDAGIGARFLTRRHDEKTGGKFSENASGIGVAAVGQQDGKIVLVSTVYFAFDHLRGIVLRLNGDGSLDKTFNQTGFVLVELPGVTHRWNYASGVVVQQDGKVLVCGDFSRESSDESPDAYVIRYDQSGNVDTGYNNSGVVTIIDSNRWLDLGAMTLKPDGGIIATGTAEGDIKREGLIVALNASGSFNLVFNNGQPLFSDFLEHGLSWRRCALQMDGKIIVTGQGGGAFVDENSSMVTARYFFDGKLDLTFGDKGWVVFNDDRGIDLHRGSAVMADNRVVVYGYISFAPIPIQGNVVRYLG